MCPELPLVPVKQCVLIFSLFVIPFRSIDFTVSVFVFRVLARDGDELQTKSALMNCFSLLPQPRKCCHFFKIKFLKIKFLQFFDS